MAYNQIKFFTHPTLDRLVEQYKLSGHVERVATATGAQWALIGPSSAPGTTLLGKTVTAAGAALRRMVTQD